MNWVDPNDHGIVGSMPTVFWAEAYANFGVLGVVFVPFVIGVVVYTVYYFVDKKIKLIFLIDINFLLVLTSYN